jgi:hypothetical protein
LVGNTEERRFILNFEARLGGLVGVSGASVREGGVVIALLGLDVLQYRRLFRFAVDGERGHPRLTGDLLPNHVLESEFRRLRHLTVG